MFIVYLISVFEKLNHLIPLVFTIGIILFVIYSIVMVYKSDPDSLTSKEKEKLRPQLFKQWKSVLKKFVVCTIVIMTLYVLIPDRKTSYTMLASYGVEKVLSNKDVKKVAGNSLKVLNMEMEKYLKSEKDSESKSKQCNN